MLIGCVDGRGTWRRILHTFCCLSILMASEEATAPLAVVHYGDKAVHISESEADVTLQDICDALGVTLEKGVCVAERSTGRVTATLPFDIIARPRQERAAKRVKVEGATQPEVDTDVLTGSDEENEEPVLQEYELVQRSTEPVAATAELPSSSVEEAAASAPDGHFKKLVDIGAVELLSDQSAPQLAALEPYNPQTAPSLLNSVTYPVTVYSPHRRKRDPHAAEGRQFEEALGGEEVDEKWCVSFGYHSGVEEYSIPTAPVLGEVIALSA